MVTNFEEITADLTEDEKKLVPIIMEHLVKYTSHNPVKSKEFIEMVNMKMIAIGIKKQLRDVKLRKLCNFIRSNGLQPIIATSEGYYVSEDPEEVLKQIKSMRERANSINMAADGMEQWMMRNI